MDQVRGPGRLVQRVDILRYGEDVPRIFTLELGERVMGGVRQSPGVTRAAEIVEFVHPRRIAGEARRRRHLVDVEFRPKAAFVAERAEPAPGREPGAGQDDDRLEAHPGGLLEAKNSCE